MALATSLEAPELDAAADPVWVAVGVFDGLHLGHRALIGEMVRRARAAGGSAAVVTFDDHPLRVLAPPHAPRRLATRERRRRLFAELGVDLLVEVPFTRDFAATLPRDFLADVLGGRLRAAGIVCGADFRFGHDGRGDLPMLREWAEARGVDVVVVSNTSVGGARVSSTAARDAVMQGRIDEAERFLARPYEIVGRVVEGDRRGRTIGYPTANLETLEHLAVPGRGVYACRAFVVDDEQREQQPTSATPKYGAMVNVGVRPTFDGVRETVEAHLFDFAGDLYGRLLALEFVARLRGEQKFDGIEAIRAQLARDEAAARSALAG